MITLIQTSQSRKKELQRFVSSLNAQCGVDLKSLQLVFVDQGDNKDVFKNLHSDITFKYVKSECCSLSHARNLAFPYVKGDFIAFADDDCWYDKDTILHVCKFLNQGYDGVFGVVMNEKNQHCNVFPSEAQKLTYTHHCGAMSASMFVKFDPELKFDENIGVGSPYNLGSGEETDYLLSYMEKHPDFDFYFTPDIIIRHPVVRPCTNEAYFTKSYSYARGFGYVLKKHCTLPLLYKLKQFIRPLGGMIIYSFTNRLKAKKSFYLLKGRLEGYFYKIQ